jgi:protein tyrosine phosphatase
MVTKPWIENVSFIDIENGHHFDAGNNSVLIQIDMDWPDPLYKFGRAYQFKFLDIDRPDTYSIDKHNAKMIASVLKAAFERGHNVIVHCVAGVCRSGGVVEAGIALGFQDTEKFRIPNVLVKNMILKELGLSSDYEN